MRVIQNKSLAARNVRILWTIGAVFLAVGLGCYVWMRMDPKSSFIPLAAMIFASSGAVWAFGTSLNWWFGDLGERLNVRDLKSLPDDYLAITNVVLPDTKQGDIDLLLLGPHGVLVVEVKTYAARYAANGDDWVNIKENGYRKKMKSPSRQLKRNVKAVEAHLKKRGVAAAVHGVLVLNDRADVKIEAPTVAVQKRRELAEYVRGLPGKEEWPGLEAAFGE